MWSYLQRACRILLPSAQQELPGLLLKAVLTAGAGLQASLPALPQVVCSAFSLGFPPTVLTESTTGQCPTSLLLLYQPQRKLLAKVGYPWVQPGLGSSAVDSLALILCQERDIYTEQRDSHSSGPFHTLPFFTSLYTCKFLGQHRQPSLFFLHVLKADTDR